MSKGQGIASLLKDSHLLIADTFEGVNLVDVDSIVVNQFQPRKLFSQKAIEELAASIAIHGVIQPLTVRQLDNKKFELIAGERRWRASKLAGLKQVPAFLRNVEDVKSLELALLENLKREDLNPLEIAWAYKGMIEECNYSQEQMAERVGKNRATVSNYLRLLSLPEQVQKALLTNKINMGQARPLIPIEDLELQLYILDRTVTEELSAREVEKLTKQGLPGNLTDNEAFKEDLTIEEKLVNKYSVLPIKLKAGRNKGGQVQVIIKKPEDLDILKSLVS